MGTGLLCHRSAEWHSAPECKYAIEFAAQSRAEVYAVAQECLVQPEYVRQGKRQRGAIRAYLSKLTPGESSIVASAVGCDEQQYGAELRNLSYECSNRHSLFAGCGRIIFFWYDRNRLMNQASRILARSFLGKDCDPDLISREAIACKAWKKAVGKRLAARTHALKLVRDRLVVEVEDEIWRNNLWSLRYQILQNLEKCLGPEIVGDLEFRVMPLRREPRRAEAILAAPANLLDDAAGIEDPGLRRNYRRARAREIALQKTA